MRACTAPSLSRQVEDGGLIGCSLRTVGQQVLAIHNYWRSGRGEGGEGSFGVLLKQVACLISVTNACSNYLISRECVCVRTSVFVCVGVCVYVYVSVWVGG